MKRTIIIFGNCQAHVFTLCLNSIPLFQEKYEILWEGNVDYPNWGLKKGLSQAQIENCVCLMEQRGRKDIEFPHKEMLPSDCVLIRFPYMKLVCLWPLVSHDDPRNKPEPPVYRDGRFPYGDRIIIDWIKKGIPKRKIFDDYMNLRIKDHVDLDQLYEEDLKRIREVDNKCDIRIYKLIKEQFRVNKIFGSYSHPTDETLKIFLMEMLEKSGLLYRQMKNDVNSKNEKQNLSQSIIDGIDSYFKQPKFDAVQLPIHPQICTHFGLTWANSKTRFPYYDYGQLTFEEYIHNYIFFEGPEI
jgi:hypothetical protein